MSTGLTASQLRARVLAAQVPAPPVDKCQRCGADAQKHLSWDVALGWCCSNCGGSDADE